MPCHHLSTSGSSCDNHYMLTFGQEICPRPASRQSQRHFSRSLTPRGILIHAVICRCRSPRADNCRFGPRMLSASPRSDGPTRNLRQPSWRRCRRCLTWWVWSVIVLSSYCHHVIISHPVIYTDCLLFSSSMSIARDIHLLSIIHCLHHDSPITFTITMSLLGLPIEATRSHQGNPSNIFLILAVVEIIFRIYFTQSIRIFGSQIPFTS